MCTGCPLCTALQTGAAGLDTTDTPGILARLILQVGCAGTGSLPALWVLQDRGELLSGGLAGRVVVLQDCGMAANAHPPWLLHSLPGTTCCMRSTPAGEAEHSSSPASQNSHKVFLKGALTACLVIWGADCVRFATAVSLTAGGGSCCSKQCRGSAKAALSRHRVRVLQALIVQLQCQIVVGVRLAQQPRGATCHCKATTAAP